MSLSSLLLQFLTGLSSASSLFLVGAGLSLIFGVTRIVNFAHGSFFMVGIYLAYTLVEKLGTLGFWPAVLIAALAVGVIGALIEMVLLRRIYKSPELFQLLATFALVLVIKDAVLYFWGPDELLGPRAPGLSGSVDILGRQFPTYDLFLIVVGPVVLGLMWLLLTRTRWGTLVRAATQDREMVSALGVNQAWLFTAVFALGATLAALGGALQLPREPATLAMDLNTIGAAFVVVVVGGMGSIPGAYVAALLLSEIKAVCIWLGVVEIFGYSVSFSKLTLVVDFIVMAIVLVWRPWGLLGRPQAPSRYVGMQEEPLRRASKGYLWLVAALGLALMAMPLLTADSPYTTVLMIDLLIAALFAASLHFIMGPAGMHSFGHAAYFGLGAYGAALLVRASGMPMELALVVAPLVAAIGAFVYGWFAVRLSGVYLAMLTLAFAQITWAVVYQWDSFTGGSNGLTGVWPSEWLSDKRTYYWLTLVLVAAGILMLRRVLFSPFGYALRAGRDSVLRADAIGIDVKRMQWTAFVIAGAAAGLAGALYAFSKGSISPESLSVDKSVDGLVMVLLGGIQTLAGPVVGAVTFSWLHDTVARNTDYWRATLGAIILLLVLLFPQGIAGFAKQLSDRLLRGRRRPEVDVALKEKRT
ncbi:amino acid/amide ABC transporter membrane protein 1 (HAAT family) /amino acid/amide ABC transporter membrane protein 2 (HAAT family) [Variovorax beijingensis]|uniref:Branched-chain amino acid transport system permease protein n=2 Tax=Variovorax TaxID=34072 RepID=A0AAE3XWY8_VARPD|nr:MULTISPECIES: ABC transporter permease [Variovorax]MBD9667608.1 ABC transporter permease [Variovorax sp. VRV01]MDP9963913.1 branched-chain amino acid transport system permease protein [Variovorax paradoxus]MDR6425347.1 branched-chain amino acid transport system permease protein [Variovorax paradoxus]TWD90370.1 amino acid/amide ABC transporter membrane protein 1 (HAAT family) /amino acid/amide ABC transporter membrane protein 2 (HAAT family) [Variovorax beijingensis]